MIVCPVEVVGFVPLKMGHEVGQGGWTPVDHEVGREGLALVVAGQEGWAPVALDHGQTRGPVELTAQVVARMVARVVAWVLDPEPNFPEPVAIREP